MGGKDHIILCAMHPEVAKLFLHWFTLIVPTAQLLTASIARGLGDPEEHLAHLQKAVFTHFDNSLNTEQFSHILQYVMTCSPSNSGLGKEYITLPHLTGISGV